VTFWCGGGGGLGWGLGGRGGTVFEGILSVHGGRWSLEVSLVNPVFQGVSQTLLFPVFLLRAYNLVLLFLEEFCPLVVLPSSSPDSEWPTPPRRSFPVLDRLSFIDFFPGFTGTWVVPIDPSFFFRRFVLGHHPSGLFPRTFQISV